ncbi:MAG: ureidoglycolate lyase [Paracoccus sp. (in: a-proteobacteria)]|uniref:ureidoglycolate lyase n=1 Tax=Paracoccus sp. TaxID=267 RepID=UPI0026E0E365|nr:ureidoglycolate lyase [Paracoccus sp. (in: a-proteobacteria)]MDO5611818.1 ureidoglycolate lyase [Paracoccus sp. (in: a-proteobacteria)]
MTTITARPISATAFAPFGDLLTPRAAPDRMINAGRCERHHALATVQRGEGEAIISLFRSQPVSLPYVCTLLERHPLGSQAFMPLRLSGPWLSVVAPDHDGRPGAPLAFLVPADMGVNLRAGVWHGVLTPLDHPADFLVIDRDGPGLNLQEVAIPPVTITA